VHKKLRIGSAAVIACLLLVTGMLAAGCGKQQVSSSKSVYKIGAVLSLTGAQAALGVPEQNALKLFEKQINDQGGVEGHRVQFVIEDDQSLPANSKSMFTKLVSQEGVNAVIGTSFSGGTAAMTDEAQKDQIPLIGLSATTSLTHPVKKWTFRTPPTTQMVVERELLYIQKTLKLNKIAVLYDSGLFGTEGYETIKSLAGKYGQQVVTAESYGTTDPDMTAQLTKIKGTPAQALIVWGTGPAPSIIAKNMKQLAMTIPYLGSHGIANQTFVQLAGDAANGVVFPAGRMLVPSSIPTGSDWRNVVDKFRTDYKAAYNTEANTFAGHGWDAALIMTEAMKAAIKENGDQEKLSAAVIRTQIEKTKDLQGIAGAFTYTPSNHDGLKVSDLIMVKIVNGAWTQAKPS
jgi:branched-chain amino acid transport system substrate-binding protein